MSLGGSVAVGGMCQTNFRKAYAVFADEQQSEDPALLTLLYRELAESADPKESRHRCHENCNEAKQPQDWRPLSSHAGGENVC